MYYVIDREIGTEKKIVYKIINCNVEGEYCN